MMIFPARNRFRSALPPLLAGLLFLVPAAWASVTIEFFFGSVDAPVDAVGVLIVDTGGNGFTSPGDQNAVGASFTAGQTFGGGDDIIVAVLQAESGPHWNGGVGFAETLEHLDYDALGIAPGAPLIFYVFPAITNPAQTLPAGADFQSYRRSSAGGAGGDLAFITPPDGAVHTLSVLETAYGGDTDFDNPGPDEQIGGGTVGDDHGNTAALATVVAPGSSTPGVLTTGDRDFFKVTLLEASRLTVFTQGNTDTFGSLFDAGGSPLNDPGVDDDNGTDLNFQIEVLVMAGTYTIEVTGDPGNYDLLVQATSITGYRPDLTAGKNAGSQKGQNIYAGTQRAVFVSARARPVRGVFTAGNDGSFDDDIVVRGSRGNKFFKVVYSDPSGNVTAAITAGSYRISALSPADPAKAIAVLIKPNKGKLKKRTRRGIKFIRKKITLSVSGSSTNQPGASDTAQIQAKVK